MIPTWAERCEKFGNEIVTNAMIQQVMQEEIDELRSKVDKMRDDIVSLTDNLFSERRECLKLEKQINAFNILVKEQDKKIINLSFDLAYANRTDEFRKELALQKLSDISQEIEQQPVGSDWWKGDPTCGGIAENYISKKDKK